MYPWVKKKEEKEGGRDGGREKDKGKGKGKNLIHWAAPSKYFDFVNIANFANIFCYMSGTVNARIYGEKDLVVIQIV